MKKFLRYILFLLIITLLSIQFAFADEVAITFSDLDETHWAFGGITKLVEKGIIIGYSDGTFKPDGNITRAELVKITNMVFGYTQKQENTNFPDIKAEDWFYDNVLIAQKEGYIIGYPDGTFKPEGLITREEFCKILDVINGFVELPFNNYPEDEVSSWAVEYVNRIISNRIITLDENNNFRATEKATRAEVCDAIAKFIIENDIVDETSSDSNEELTKEELYDTIDKVIYELSNKVMKNIEINAQKEIVNDIIDNMNAYREDNTHDYEKAAEAVFEKYKNLSDNEREALKREIQISVPTKNLLKLKNFFFPDMKI